MKKPKDPNEPEDYKSVLLYAEFMNVLFVAPKTSRSFTTPI